jgi:predicted dehydrogenase
MSATRKYAIVGLGHRSYMYVNALIGDHCNDGALVAVCDLNPGRAQVAAEAAKQAGIEVRVYAAEDFDRMIAETRPDRVIVTVPDLHHAEYIVRAMELGCDVLTEKPLTVDADSIARIMAARKVTGRSLIVGFNYRYSPVRTLLKQVLMSGVIGHVKSIAFEWLLDTHHGADYFRRWHRNKENSGGLFVHKATHHFDLLNWWLATTPRRVTALGQRVFYRPEIADALGLQPRGERCTGCPAFDRCGVRLDIAGNDHLRTLYAENEEYDGYLRDKCVFSPNMDIEDQMSALIEYEGGIVANYKLTAYNPCEGYRVTFDGTRGRIEHSNLERGFVRPDGSLIRPALPEENRITVQPHFGRAYDLVMPSGAQGPHSGGDKVMLRRLFGAPSNDQYGHVADERAGAWSAMVGIGANTSLRTHMPVELAELVPDVPLPDYAPEPFGPAQIWKQFDPARYPFLEGARIIGELPDPGEGVRRIPAMAEE